MEQEEYSKSPIIEAISDIKVYNQLSKDVKVFASARFIEEKLSGPNIQYRNLMSLF